MKKCTKCTAKKPATQQYFYIRNDTNQFSHWCKKCHRDNSKKYRKNNKEKLKEQRKETKVAISIKNKLHYKANKEKILQQKKEYRKENKDKINAYKRVYEKEKYHSNPSHRLRTILGKVIRSALKERGTSKRGQSFLDKIGYSIEELKKHLESQFEPWMNWDNHGLYRKKLWNDDNSSTWTWQIDHIIPHSEFQYTSMNDFKFKCCWALKNLRPLSSKQNCLDGASKIRHLE